MSTDDALPSPEFLRVFGTWFEVDLIDLSDDAEVKSTAGSVAADLLRQDETADEIAAAVSEMLAEWGPDTAAAFVDASGVDWLADEASEEQLKSILSDIAEAVETVEDAGPAGDAA